MIKAIIFDFDGVLVESVDIKTDAFARLFASYGEEVVGKVVKYHLEHTGVSRYEKFKYIYKEILHRNLDDRVLDGLCASFSALVMDEVTAAPYVKGAKQFLDEWSGKYACFILSATPQAEIEEIVRRRGMAGYFRGIYGSPRKKEDSLGEIILRAAVKPGQTVYVGDALSDWKAARSHRVNFVARINNNEAIFRGIDCVKLKDITGLKEALKAINHE